MSMTINKELPNPAALKAEFPIHFSSSSAPARRITKKASANTPAALPV